jgi:hypothetical protein
MTLLQELDDGPKDIAFGDLFIRTGGKLKAPLDERDANAFPNHHLQHGQLV